MLRFNTRSLTALLPALVLIAALPCAADDDASGQSPEAVVAGLEQMLIEHMKAGDEMTFEQRFERLRPHLAEVLALDRMGRYIFGRDWQSFDEARRARFTEAFGDLSAATYAAQFSDYNGERFEPVGVDRQGEDRTVVRRKLVTGSGREVAFDYLMTTDEDGDWRIVTIITDGVSDLALKRSQYRRILDEADFDAVIERIRSAIDAQRDGG
jgi:phospholipid transport system substrate-binding protein